MSSASSPAPIPRPLPNTAYEPATVERAVQAWWAARDSFRVTEDPAREKFYCLSMFPYPSGRLHMGHVRNYTIGDVLSRFHRMNGKNVLQPMGFDAFGLPAENAAIKGGVAPGAWTDANMDYMVGQLKGLGLAFDWSRRLATCEPGYYRWEQWFFLRLLEKGLVYRKNSVVNWDPVDRCVLANEQVIDGRGWRSGALVESREIPQWFIRITAYADALLADLDQLSGWPERVRTMQANWIGKSRGLDITFAPATTGAFAPVTVFTTRPDTLFGVAAVIVAAQHPLALTAAARDGTVALFVEACGNGGTAEAELAKLDKKGVPLGIDVRHPLTGACVPVWAGNFVLMSYGTGAVMAVPAHDERDYVFAKAYGLPITVVLGPDAATGADVSQGAFTEKGVLRNSGRFDGLDFEAAFDAMTTALGPAGAVRENLRLRDWGISRQRYWGCPIPIIYCDVCGAVPVPDEPVAGRAAKRPDARRRGQPTGARTGLCRTVACPTCGARARRETDTFDTFVDSSWYFARYTCPDQATAMLDERARYWLPVDQYIGGIEHAVLHLLYARFFYKAMRDIGLPVAGDEPFTRLLTQGMVNAATFYREDENGRRTWISPAEVTVVADDKGRALSATWQADGAAVEIGAREKMSKSKNNGADPEAIVASYGADAARLFMMFTAPPDQGLEWSDAGIEGAARFLKRLWRMLATHLADGPVEAASFATLALDATQAGVRRQTHDTLARITDDLGRRQMFNTAIAAAMELVNTLAKFDDATPTGRCVRHEALDMLTRALAPIVPHICHAAWAAMGHPEAVMDAPWPPVDEAARATDTVTVAVQVNGKLRGTVVVPRTADADTAEGIARGDAAVARALAGQVVKKRVWVPGRLLNFVV